MAYDPEFLGDPAEKGALHELLKTNDDRSAAESSPEIDGAIIPDISPSDIDTMQQEGTSFKDSLYAADAASQLSFHVEIMDEALDRALHEVLKKDIGSPISPVELGLIKELDLRGKGILDISPLRYCIALTDLSLSSNRISDISALSH